MSSLQSRPLSGTLAGGGPYSAVTFHPWRQAGQGCREGPSQAPDGTPQAGHLGWRPQSTMSLSPSLDPGIMHVLGQRLQSLGDPPLPWVEAASPWEEENNLPTPGWGPALSFVLAVANYTAGPGCESLWASAQSALPVVGSFSSFRCQLTALLLRSLPRPCPSCSK